MQETYIKPNMAALPEKIGKEVMEIIMNSTPPDLSAIRKRVDENKKKIAAERANGIK